MKLEDYMKGSNVVRCHALPANNRPTVGHHTMRVLLIIDEIYGGNPPPDLVRAALYHDIFEHVIGDIPAYAKMMFPELRKVAHEAESTLADEAGLKAELVPNSTAFLVLKIADMLEFIFWAQEELQLGNRGLEKSMTFAINLLKQRLAVLKTLDEELYERVKEI